MTFRPTLIIHGGAGVGQPHQMPAERQGAVRGALRRILGEAGASLGQGASALDAVTLAVRLLEDDPLFNAGRGGAMTSEGTVEHDASIMCGRTLKAGATTGTRTVRNPVLAARAVMERTPHVMMYGEAAERVAREAGLEFCEPRYFETPERRAALARIQAAAKGAQELVITEQDRHGTVGAVALDAEGHVAAATSTGGRTNKLAGRIGDTPIIGAGNYADDRSVAVSCTGSGEHFMRTVLAHRLAMQIALAGASVGEATKIALGELIAIGGSGGLIALSPQGEVAFGMTGSGMHRGIVRIGDEPSVAIFADEEIAGDFIVRS